MLFSHQPQPHAPNRPPAPALTSNSNLSPKRQFGPGPVMQSHAPNRQFELPITNRDSQQGEQFDKISGCPLSFSEDASQCSGSNFFMRGDDNCKGGAFDMFLKDHMATALTDKLKTVFLEGLYKITGRNDRQTRHRSDGDFKRGDERGFVGSGYFFGIGVFQEKLDSLKKVFSGLFNCSPLAGHTKLGARGYVPFSVLFDDGREVVSHIHSILPFTCLRKGGAYVS